MNSKFVYAPACGGDLGKLNGNIYRVHSTIDLATLTADNDFKSSFQQGDTLQIETTDSKGLFQFETEGVLKKYIVDEISATSAVLTDEKDLSGATITDFEDILSITAPDAGKYLLVANIEGYSKGDDTAINAKVTKADNTDVSVTVHLCDLAHTTAPDNFEHYESYEVTTYVVATAKEVFKIRASQKSNAHPNIIKPTNTKLTLIRLA